MVLIKTSKYKYERGRHAGMMKPWYRCMRYPDCKATHGAHPDGRPLGKPADGPTKEARIRAHAAFDELWKSGRITRVQSYRVLQHIMGMTKDQAHISLFDSDDCESLIFRVNMGMADNAISELGFDTQ